MINPTYHNDKDLEFVIEGHDLLGNEMFKKQTYYYKLGKSVRYVVPQFDEYYIEEDVLEFCIKEDVHLNLIYKHYINSHLDILSDEGEIIYCGPLNNEYHELQYTDRFGEEKEYVLPCMFEGDTWTYELPYIKGYYTDNSIITMTVQPHIILKNAYHKLADIEISYISERGKVLETIYISPEDIEDEYLNDNVFKYIIEVPDNLIDDYYYEPVQGKDYIEIILTGKYNKAEIRLNHYRSIHINTIKTDYDASTPQTIITQCLPGYRVGDEYTIIPEEIADFYTDITQFTFTIDEYYKYDEENDEYVVNVDLNYYKLLTFRIYFLYNNTEITEIENPEVLTGLHHNETYLYQAPEIEGYYTNTKYMYLRDNRNKILHVEYYKNTEE